MRFIDALNEYMLLLCILLGMLLFIGIRLGYRNGGWNRHIAYIWTLIIYTVYIFISPLYFFLTRKNVIIGTDISQYYGLGFFLNMLGIFFFIIGYWLRGKTSFKRWNEVPVRYLKNPKLVISILFYTLYAITLVNLAIGGANIQEVFLGNEILGLGARGGSYFLQNFTDSLICIIVLAYLYDVPWKSLSLWILASFFLFSLLGFRYRIMLSLFGILFAYLYKHKINAKRIVLGAGLAVIFFYGILFTTENRRLLTLKQYDKLNFSPFDYKYENLFIQTRGAMADLAVYKLYNNVNRTAEYDYGLTMFGYVFIRMIPRSIYPDKDRFYPPPQLATTHQAYEAWWGKFSGEATLSMAAFYIAFGWLGIILGHFFWGLLLRRFGDSICVHDKIQVATYIVIALATFQWISRGYFPQIVDQTVYMLIPLWVLRYYSKKLNTE